MAKVLKTVCDVCTEDVDLKKSSHVQIKYNGMGQKKTRYVILNDTCTRCAKSILAAMVGAMRKINPKIGEQAQIKEVFDKADNKKPEEEKK